MLLFLVKYLDFYLYPGHFCKLKCQGKKGSVSTAFLKSMFQLTSCEKQTEAQFLHIVDPVSQTLEDAPFFLCTCCEKVVAYTLASSICYHWGIIFGSHGTRCRTCRNIVVYFFKSVSLAISMCLITTFWNMASSKASGLNWMSWMSTSLRSLQEKK